MKKENKIHILCAVIGISIGFAVAYFNSPRIVEEHLQWCEDGSVSVRTYKVD